MTRRPFLLAALCATALAAPAFAQQRPDPNAVQTLLNQFPHLTGIAPQPVPAPVPAPAPTLEQTLGQAFLGHIAPQPAAPAAGLVGQMLGQPQPPASPLAGTVSQLLGQPAPQPAPAGLVGQLLGQPPQGAPGGLQPLDQLLLQQAQPQLAPPAQLFGGGQPGGAEALLGQALGAYLGQPQPGQPPAAQGGLLPPTQLFGGQPPQGQPAPQIQGGPYPGQIPGQPQIQPPYYPPAQPAPGPFGAAPIEAPASSAYLGGAPAPAPLPAAAAPSREFFGFPRYARVSGVPAGDTLKVRAEPRAQAQQLGELRPESNTLEVLETNPDGSWSRILWQGGDAWVSSRYLSPVEPARIRGSRAPIGLQCSGTEPFWGLKIEDERTLSYSSPENPAGTRLALSSVSPSPNGDATLFNALPAGPERFTAIIAPAQCSDGMSEANYGWRIDLIRALEGPGAPPPSLFGGCCRLPS